MDNLESNLTGTDFTALAAANPYSGAADLYNKSSWQTFVSDWLGQRTEADAWKENMAIQEREYNAALLQKQHDEEYNDPTNQVNRLRKAGLNPDLNAGSVDPGTPGDMGTDMSTPMQSSGSPLEDLSNVGNMLLTAVTSAVGLSGDLLSLGQLRESVASQKIGNAGDILKLAQESVLGSLPANLSSDPEGRATQISNAGALVVESVGSMLPRKYRRRFKQNVSRFYTTLPTTMQEYEMRSKRASDRLDYVRKTASRFYDDQDEVMKDINDEMIKLFDELASTSAQNAVRAAGVESGSLSVQEKRNTKEGEYLDAVDGALAGAAENAGNQLDIQTSKMTKEINDSMSSIVHRLNVEAKKGNVLAESVLLIFNVLRLKNLPSAGKAVKAFKNF